MLLPLARRFTCAGGGLTRLWNTRGRLVDVTAKWISGGPKLELLYQHNRPRLIMLARLFGVSQLIAWPYMCYAVSDLMEKKNVARRNPEGDNTRFKRISRSVAESGIIYFSQVVGCVIGMALVVSSAIVARQTIRKIHLVGRNRVRFETYGLVKSEIIEVPIQHVSAIRGRNPNALSYIPVKVSGRFIYLLVDQFVGEFPVPKLYDMTVGVTRKL